MSLKQNDKQALSNWEDLKRQIHNSTPVDTSETEADKRRRIASLEKKGNEHEWVKYYFPQYAFCESASFHKRSFKKFVHKKRVYRAKAWCRGLSKSTNTMFEVLYLTLVKKHPTYMLMVSKNGDNAELLLQDYKGNLEANQRILNDYGLQERAGKWTSDNFTTRSGATFRAVGMGQNPRGAKNEAIRANVLVFDDADDDEVCRNLERLDQAWEWIERAVIPTVDISADYYISFDNNIIAEDSLALRAQSYADYVEKQNIVNEKGESSWPEKNSLQDIEDIKAKMSYASFQAEYMNNPTSQGKTFKEITWGKCPPMHTLPFVVNYVDPATSNKDIPRGKKAPGNSAKASTLIGYKNGVFYIYKAKVDNVGQATFISWLYAMRDFVNKRSPLYTFVENNTLQKDFFDLYLKPKIYEMGKGLPEGPIDITTDEGKKDNKWVRIETMLEPLVRNGKLVFNIAEKNDPHMLTLETQFLTAKPTSKNLDGPDAVEGGVSKTKEKLIALMGGSQITGYALPTNKRRF